MQYLYTALLLHKADQEITTKSVTKVLKAAGVEVDDARVKTLVAAVGEIDIPAVNVVLGTSRRRQQQDRCGSSHDQRHAHRPSHAVSLPSLYLLQIAHQGALVSPLLSVGLAL